MKLEPGQVAVVTGAASGIGLALAQAFAQRGLRVVLSDISEDHLKTAQAKLEAKGATVLTVASDVGDPNNVDQLRDKTLQHFNRIDLICNNAGIAIAGKALWEYDQATWDKMLHVNLQGVINGIRSFVPQLVKQGSGHVLNTASLAGVGTVPFNGIYNACKYAMVSMTETMRMEMDDRGIAVGTTVLCPGLVRTNIGKEGQDGRPEDPNAKHSYQETQGAEVLDANFCAERTLAAIEADKLHVFPNRGSGAMVRKRLDHLLQDLESWALCPALPAPDCDGEILSRTEPTRECDSASRLGRGEATVVIVPFTVNMDFGGGLRDRAFRAELDMNPAAVFLVTPEWTVISNTQLPIRHFDRVFVTSRTGLGDIIQNTWVSPASGSAAPKPQVFSWGLGAVLAAPAAAPSIFGQHQWGAGPSGFATWRNGPLTLGLVANQTWAFANFRRGRLDLNRFYTYPFVTYTLRTKTSLNFSSDVTYDWTGSQWYVPVTVGVSQPVSAAGQQFVFGAALRTFGGGQTGRQNFGSQVSMTYFWSRK